ncbi:hypothetical protein ABN763_10150 [Spongiivirga sp. MCCC 1A20706]|uniref:hypothetical protein n=1 Tax=Spongiivirga sp. MCCC 1A20706 TaxID=3160963 RepID=UPI003977D7FA
MILFLLRLRGKVRYWHSFLKNWWYTSKFLRAEYNDSTVFVPVFISFFVRFYFVKQHILSQPTTFRFALRDLFAVRLLAAYSNTKAQQYRFHHIQVSQTHITMGDGILA